MKNRTDCWDASSLGKQGNVRVDSLET